MNVLIACEESQAVCKALRERGHRAFSCDILESSGGHPEWHIKGDALAVINGDCEFTLENGETDRQVGKWDLLIAHPPCTYLTVTGNSWFNVDRYGEKAIKRIADREEAYEFFMKFVYADCDRIAIENPIGYMSTHYRKPDQIVHPYFFGDPVRKATCLWLKGLQPLEPTNMVEPQLIQSKGKKKTTYSGPAYVAIDENGKQYSWDHPMTARIRSKTYKGVADAMASQWGEERDIFLRGDQYCWF